MPPAQSGPRASGTLDAADALHHSPIRRPDGSKLSKSSDDAGVCELRGRRLQARRGIAMAAAPGTADDGA
jgi:hypothetical protein